MDNASMSISNLTNGTAPAPAQNADPVGKPVATTASESQSNVSKTDPSLLHQITSLQKENQDLLQERREMETRLKDLEGKMQEADAVHQKEKQEFIEVQKKEMEEHFKNFMQEWITSMEKENPEVIERMKGGIGKLIEGGRNKDKMWEIMCCASRTHKNNVNAIEELTKTNNMLMERNKELENTVRTNEGFANDDARVSKRMRTSDALQGAPPSDMPTPGSAQTAGSAQLELTDCWGHFESLMSANKNAAYY